MADFQSILIDHVNLGVTDLDRSLPVYLAALEPLGPRVILHPEAEQAESNTRMIGFGPAPGRPVFWLIDGQKVGERTHIAFAAKNREAVDAFFEAALEADASDNGGPGIRDYHPDYYGAFVLDPDDINVEAVCHRPE